MKGLIMVENRVRWSDDEPKQAIVTMGLRYQGKFVRVQHKNTDVAAAYAAAYEDGCKRLNVPRASNGD